MNIKQPGRGRPRKEKSQGQDVEAGEDSPMQTRDTIIRANLQKENEVKQAAFSNAVWAILFIIGMGLGILIGYMLGYNDMKSICALALNTIT